MLDTTKLFAEMVVALASSGAAIATLVEPQWIERPFDVAPDGGDGSLETWVVVTACVAAGAVFGWRAAVRVRRDRVTARRLQTARNA